MEKNWLDFDDLDPIFKVTLRLRLVGKWLVCTLSPEGMSRFRPDLQSYIFRTWKRTDEILVTLTLFKVTGGPRLLENSLSALYLLKEWTDFN